MTWKPNVTVAAVVQRDNKFLLVEEETDAGLAFNQPAGHLEENESLLQAVVREVLEETAYHFEPTGLVGIYQWTHPVKGITYLRFAFSGELTGYEAGRPLDTGIVAARWLSFDEVKSTQNRHRSPLILQCVEDLIAGQSFSLELIRHYDAC